MQLTARSFSRQACAGLAMLEALTALLVLTAGAVGVLWWQQQASLRQQQLVNQWTAMLLAGDLADRMRINAAQTALYALAWGESRQSAQDCAANACSRSQLARWDMAQWQQALRVQLPKADASVYPLPQQSGWWGISIAWPGIGLPISQLNADSAACPARMQCWNMWVRPQE